MIVAGIDPGLSGAVAVVNEHGDCESMHMPCVGPAGKRIVNGHEVVRFLRERDVEFVLIEQVGSMPKQGVKSMFTFGCCYGQLIGLTQGMVLPHEFVTPQRWKKAMGVTSDKETSRRKAIELLPRSAFQFALKKDEARAEAALIALYHLTKRGGQ